MSTPRLCTPLLSALTLAVCTAIFQNSLQAAEATHAQPAQSKTQSPAFWSWAQLPPMGWNSYDAFGDSVTEAEVMANARYMKDHLLAHGWNMIVIDFRWYDPEPTGDDHKLGTRAGAQLAADKFGRMLPAPNRFPSAANGQGFKPLADQLHAMGLKFGFHMMRGIPRQAVQAMTPIEGSTFTAADAGDPKDHCSWCPDMDGVRTSPAGQAWYDAMFRLYASWGLDFVKVDDLSNPYHDGEIEMIRKAIDKCGRPIVLSTSPGPTPVNKGAHVMANANMWRISGDFWDNWKKLDHQFDLIAQWKGYGGPGHWPDADMIPLGHLCIRSGMGGKDHTTHFTRDEQVTLMSLWALAPSPLMLGMNLPDNDDWTTSLLTNDDVIAVNQDPLGKQAVRLAEENGVAVWAKDLKGGAKAVGFFNRSDAPAIHVPVAGLTGSWSARDLWSHKEMGPFKDGMAISIPAHGAVLLRLTQAQ